MHNNYRAVSKSSLKKVSNDYSVREHSLLLGKDTDMNIKLLRKIRRQILRTPRQFNILVYHAKDQKCVYSSIRAYPFSQEECGSVHCIAGWAQIFSGRFDGTFSGAIARQVLELEYEQSLKLFHISWWPENLRRQYYDATTNTQKAKVAAERIDHFIKTGL